MTESKKIGVIGAGGIGFNLAQSLARNGYSVFLHNRYHADENGKPTKTWIEREGKVDDLNDAVEYPVTLTPELSDLDDAYAVIITAGATRKDGETRADLARKNVTIIKTYLPLIANNPDCMVMVISNPVDSLTRYLIEATALNTGRAKEDIAKKIIGVSYVDTTRLRNLTRMHMEKHHPDIITPEIEALVLGEHGQTMVPLISHVKINGKPLTDYASKEQIDAIVQGVVTRGNDIIVRTGTSAIVGPSIAAINMVKRMDSGKPVRFPCSTWDGQRCIGQFTEFDGNTVSETIAVSMSEEENARYRQSEVALDTQFEAFAELLGQ